MKKNINLTYYMHGKDVKFKTVDIFDIDFKKVFVSFLKGSTYFKTAKGGLWESFILSGNNFYLCESHDYFYNKKYNLEYNSDIFKSNDEIKNLINITVEDAHYNDTRNCLYFYDFYNRKKNKEILTTICIQLEYKLYQVFLDKKGSQRDPCIPGITSSKLIYNPK